MAMEGMDLDAVQPVITTLGHAVNELQTLISSTNSAYSAIGPNSWQGNDANQFHSQWPAFASALSQAHNDLTNLHTHLLSNYNQQQAASNQY